MRKKKIFWLVVAAALALLAWRAGVSAALLVAALLAAALALLFTVKWVAAGFGLKKLVQARETRGFDAMTAALKRRLGEPDAFRFVVLGDTRNVVRVAREVYRRAAGESPAVIFHTGDIVRGGTPWEFLRNHVALLGITDPAPMFCVPGNHDRGVRRDFSAFKALYGDDRFCLDFGGCRFAGFNNSGRKRVTRDDLDWLDRELGRPGAGHRFVFLHIPPAFFEETFVSDTRRRGFKENAAEFHALMRRHGVDEVFMAHIHGYATTVLEGVRYTLTAGGGAPLSGRLAREGQAFNYVVVNVSPEGVRRVVVRGRDSDWTRTEEN